MGHLIVRNLGKAYKRYPHKWARLAEWLSPSPAARHELKWVIRGLDFDIRPGDAVGIIGRNGAGKSTLLKMITGTTRPTEGSIETGGRVAALLELGMGFHPDFTGRQNVYMAAHLLGLSAAEIDAHMTQIEAFAEIGAYIDQPVRTYSSGMQVRLAFSVATAVRPDILIVDEALAVGDAAFQHKCYARIRRFKEEGTTLLFVSHDPGAVKSLCERAILLDQGRLALDGSPDAVLDYYNALIAAQENAAIVQQPATATEAATSTRSGNGKAALLSVEMQRNGANARLFQVGDDVALRIRFRKNEALEDLTLGFLIRDRLGNDVFGTNTHFLGISLDDVAVGRDAELLVRIPRLNLGLGSYNLSIALHSHSAHLTDNYDWWDKALVFEVVPGNTPHFIGVCNLPVSAMLV
jgi:lipopolysaccharide transport system ATP-binding protein